MSMNRISRRHIRRRSTPIAAVLVAVGLVLAGCAKSSSGASGGASGSGLKAGDPIRIVSLESPVANGGPDFTSGMLVAASRLNSAGGVEGHKIQIDITKHDGTPSGIVAAYRNAAAQAGVFGAVLGAAGDQIKGISSTVKLPIVTSAGTLTVLNPAAHYVFDSTFTYEYTDSALKYLLKQHPNAKKIAVLHYDAAFSESVASAVRSNCAKLGCDIVDVEAASSAASSDQLIPQLTRMRSSRADAYYIEGLNPNGWKAARQLGMFDKPIISEQWLAVPAIAGACAANCAGAVFAADKCRYNEDWTQLGAGDPIVQWCKSYVADWQAANPGKTFPIFSIYGYDGVISIAEAIKLLLDANKPITRDAIADQMAHFDGQALTSTGAVHTTPQNHGLTGSWTQGYVMTVIKVGTDGNVHYSLAPGADPAGADS
jgi:ABC-type branched-subunit amino acid transport system substrate-binding protein